MAGIPYKGMLYVACLSEGDMIGLYAGPTTEPVSTAVLERDPGSDAQTPAGHMTIWTTAGRFDVPVNSRLWVAAFVQLKARGTYHG